MFSTFERVLLKVFISFIPFSISSELYLELPKYHLNVSQNPGWLTEYTCIYAKKYPDIAIAPINVSIGKADIKATLKESPILSILPESAIFAIASRRIFLTGCFVSLINELKNLSNCLAFSLCFVSYILNGSPGFRLSKSIIAVAR